MTLDLFGNEYSDELGTDVQLFESAEFGSVRIIQEGDSFLFCGKDVAAALGYSNTKKAVNDHCKGVTKRYLLTAGGRQEAAFIPEGDLYRLVAHSKLPSAKKFERWVFDEVLPLIRKTGCYSLKCKVPDDPTLLGLPNFDDPIESALAWVEERKGRLQAEERNRTLTAQVTEMEPKVVYYEKVMTANKGHEVTEIAKDYGMGAPKFNKLLHEMGIQYKQGGQWFLYEKYQDKGYTKSATKILPDGRVVTFTMWLEKGRMFLFNELAKRGIYPTGDSTRRER